MNAKNSALLLQEIPLHSLSQKPIREISVVECSADGCENLAFPDAGGGLTVQLISSARTICWKTHSNILEIFEYSLDMDLHSSHFLITFEGSQLLPGVYVTLVGCQLHIACATVHAVHHMVLDVTNAARSIPKQGTASPSLLSSLASYDFEERICNCYYDEQDQGEVDKWCADIISLKGRSNPHLVAAVMTIRGKMILIKMTEESAKIVSTTNRTSRMSRIWAGINPWADCGGTETIVAIRVLELEGQAFIVAVCKDKKLRIWAFDTHDLVLNHHFGVHIEDDCESSNEQCDFKIRVCKESRMVSVCAEMPDNTLFLQFKIDVDSNSSALNIGMFSVLSTASHVHDEIHRHAIDFTLSMDGNLTVLWRDGEENYLTSICEMDTGIWHDAVSHPLPAPGIPLQPYQDIRESYMDYIFTPGRFSPIALRRAMSIHQRIASFSSGDLKERVAAYIQSELQNLSSQTDVDDDDMQAAVWEKFFRNLIQYQQVVSQALGLVAGPIGSLISVVKKGYLTVLSPVSTLEAVCRGSAPENFLNMLQSRGFTCRNMKDLAKLLESLGHLHDYLGVDLLDSIQQNLCLSESPHCNVINDLIPDLLEAVQESSGNNVLDTFADVEDQGTAIRMLFACLDPLDFATDFDVTDMNFWPVGSLGAELIAKCTSLYLKNRFQLSLLLYIATSIFKILPRQYNAQPDDGTEIGSRVMKYVNTFRALSWLSTAQTQNISQATLGSTLHTLSVHASGISEFHPDHGKQMVSQSILECFVSGELGKLFHAYHQFQSSKVLSLRQDVVTAAVHFLVYLLWPCGPNLMLPDFLLSNGQSIILQRYLEKELKPWCDWCPKSREYLLAHCYLHFGNFNKAMRSFIFASSGIGTEEYLMMKLLREDEDGLHQVAQEIIYFTKVMLIFERLDLQEQIISLAEYAIQVTKMQEHDPNLPILWSSVFRQSNNLSRYNDALKAIILNPDPGHRKDCLRNLAVSLCEHKKYKTLVEFKYGSLEDDMVNILEYRARGTDLASAVHNYYDILYAFHVERGNFRKAASAMYEQAYRIECEFARSSSEGNILCLQKQVDCYATCMNCLHLVTEGNRWILHPVANGVAVMTESQSSEKNGSVERPNDGKVMSLPRMNVVIHELEDIQKESLLIEMKIKLEKAHSGSQSATLGPLVSASEISAFLCHAGLYDDAAKVCAKFNLPMPSIFASLTSKCVRLSYADEEAQAKGWEWLQENGTAKAYCAGGNSSATNWTTADATYRLLQVYLENFGDAQSYGTQCYYSAAKSFLSLGAFPPAWLIKAYKSKNCPELLRLFVCFDRLEEATSLAVEIINVTKAKIGTNYNGSSMIERGAWLPYAIIEQLLFILRGTCIPTGCTELYDSLKNALDEYIQAAEASSQDAIEAAQHRAAIKTKT